MRPSEEQSDQAVGHSSVAGESAGAVALSRDEWRVLWNLGLPSAALTSREQAEQLLAGVAPEGRVQRRRVTDWEDALDWMPCSCSGMRGGLCAPTCRFREGGTFVAGDMGYGALTTADEVRYGDAFRIPVPQSTLSKKLARLFNRKARS